MVVFAQVHYLDVWRKIGASLARRMSVPFDLVVTTSHDPASIFRPRTRHLRSFRVQVVENRGRDVLPFLRALAEAPDFEIGLKIHTKKSPQRADGAQWLALLLASLLPSKRGVRDIVARMAADPRIGFVAPHGFCLPVKPWVLQNGAAMEAVMADIGHSLSDADMVDAYFAAGNMFWFRRDALGMLAAESLPALFESEAAQLDGTVAHAMERVFPVEARRQGYLTVAMPALLASDPAQPAAAIITATRLHTEEPNFLFPAPYVSPASAEFKPPMREQLLQAIMPFVGRVPRPLRRIVGIVVRGGRR
ncbi:rhamnan synthesis F family protein [Lichenihabitans sp. Uapishka_5]|uniref:rhamnan synthesis F family protein n=1 Tax=Lichenihabitans sp. Uapishka_5 TaxID=3037302 RepID=UPI0029E81094|nr:rhamnan synthesis F family protein [Lichenihabitans sp. Uapishka_5]MDX7952827.1 rhamnan synthesis F family protein [Lichenihabitans sp. Uapishka_5]